MEIHLIKQTFNRIGSATFVLVLGKLIQFILLLQLALFLDARNFVTFVSALAIAQLISLLIIPGGQQGLTAKITKVFAKNNFQEMKEILLFSISLYLIFFLLVGLILFVTNLFYNQQIFDYIEYFPVILVSVLIVLRSSITRGFNFIFKSLFFPEIVAPLFLLFILHFGNPIFELFSFGIIWSCVYFVCEIISLMICKKPIIKFLKQSNKDKIIFSMNSFNKDMFNIQISNIFLLSIFRLDVVLLSFISGPLISAPYVLVNKFVQPLSIMARILSNSTAPSISSLDATSNHTDIKNITFLSFIFIFGSLTFLALIIFFSFEFIQFYINSRYELSYEVLFYLGVTYFLLALSAPFTQNLLMTRKGNYVALINLIVAIFFYSLLFTFNPNISAILMSKLVFFSSFFITILNIVIFYRLNFFKK